MTEAVFYRQVVPAGDLVSFWGSHANQLREKLAADVKGSLRYATVFDYTDMDMRVVWATLQENSQMLPPDPHSGTNAEPLEIIRQPHGLGFLPWVTRTGGTTIHHDPAHQRVPLLFSMYQSGQL